MCTQKTLMGKLDHSRVDAKHMLKLNYFKNVLYFALNFLPREFLLVKKWEIEKTKTSFSFKSCTLGGLSFFQNNVFINKNSQGRKLSAKYNTFLK